jgi:hypothetical protein
LDAGLSAYIKGAPGIGKSTVVRDYAHDKNMDFIDLRAAQLDPVDARGVPVADIENRLTHWLPPDFLPKEGSGILFLDELNRATRDTQNALYELVLEGRIGKYILPDGWSIVSAGNRAEDGAMVQPMSRALKNRFIHFEMTVDTADWHNYAMRAHFDERVISFINYMPDALDQMETAMRKGKGDDIAALRQADAFATPRSWEFASRLLQKAIPQGMTLMDCHSLLSGAVGAPMAGELISYCNIYRELQDLDMLLQDPSSYKPLTETSQVYALCIGLISRATPQNFNNLVQILDKLPKEYMVWAMDDCLLRHPELGTHATYLDWVHKNIEYAA